jgi:hypothetical protein
LPETAGLPSSSISEASPVIRQEPVPGQDKAPHPLQTTCDNCEVNIPDVHYHCRLCRSDDYDIREICAEGGARCENQEHCLMKRTVSNKGNMTLLSTAALAPKVATHGFDAVKEFIKQLGLTTHPKDLPRSFLLAVANKFTPLQVERFETTKQPPLFLIGEHMFPTTIWQRFAVTHSALVTEENPSLGAVAKSSK